ncbi:MAG: nuclear transport factor 2 family protein, partial [Thermoanaerobaculia bacterium]
MKKTLLLALLVCAISTVALADDSEHAAIVAVVDQAYVHGVHIDGDADKMRAGMHDSFVMFVRSDKGITQMTRDAWIERLTASKAGAANATKP